MNIYAVIMAGGVGSRFWPRSKEKSPKQLLNIFGDKTMIQDTVARLSGLVEKDKIYIITNKIQKPEIINQIPDLPKDNIIEEPFGRNTAACIGLASLIIQNKDKDAITFVLPADHMIRNIDEFHKSLLNGAEFADKGKGIVTIGISPTRPETGYGYIQVDDKLVEDNIFEVTTFAEKPNYDTAVRFLESGDFLWNSGMFIWRIDNILNEIKLYLPELDDELEHIKKFINTDQFESELASAYGRLRSISIDYGIMEKSHNVYVTKGDFIWSDVGSWEEVYQLSDKDEKGNVIKGKIFTDDTSSSYIYSPKKFASVIGVDNLIVINDEDSLLVCKRERSQDVKKVVEHLKVHKLSEHL